MEVNDICFYFSYLWPATLPQQTRQSPNYTKFHQIYTKFQSVTNKRFLGCFFLISLPFIFSLQDWTVLHSTKLESESAVFIQSILIMPVHSMYFRSKKQAVEGGQCFKRDWTTLSISTADGTTTNEAMEILARPDSTRHVDWQKNEAYFTWTLKIMTERKHMPSTTSLVLPAKEVNTDWVFEYIVVCDLCFFRWH